MANIWDRVIRNLKSGTANSVEKIEAYAKMAKMKIDIVAADRKKDFLFKTLGELTNQFVKEKPKSSLAKRKDVADIINEIRELESTLTDYETKITAIKSSIPDASMRRAEDQPEDSNPDSKKE